MNPSIDRLCEVVAAALNLPSGEITAESGAENVPAWNSTGHLQALLAVEAEFSVRFNTKEMPELGSIKALAARLGSL